jgi:hypothetical protein
MLTGLVLAAVLGLPGCETVPVHETAAPRADRPLDRELAHGYALLYELCDKQQNADKVFVLKAASKPTKQRVKQIAEACGKLAKAMRRQSEAGALPALNEKGLPTIEQDARDRIEADSRNAILWGEAEKPMVLAQIDATQYGAALARSLIERHEGGPINEELAAFAKLMDQLNEALTKSVTIKEP